MDSLIDLLITGAILGATALTVYLKKRTKKIMEPDEDIQNRELNGSHSLTITRSEFDTFETRVESRLEKLEEKIDRLVFALIDKKS